MNGGAVPDPTQTLGREASGLDIRVTAADGYHRLALAGELDLSTSPLLQTSVSALIADGHTQIAVELDGVGFCDVAGLNRLISTRAELAALGGELVLHGPCPALQLLIDLLAPEPAMEMVPPLVR
jgi:anti-sigma B factor antagonist